MPDTITPVDETQQPDIELLKSYATMKDIVGELDDEALDKLGQICVRGYAVDKESVAPWMAELEEIRAMANQKGGEAKTYPWPGASDVKYPLITQAALEFNARAYPALINDGEIVKASVEGRTEPFEIPEDAPPEEQKKLSELNADIEGKTARKDRVTKYMSYQVMDRMPNWESDMDKLLMAIPTDGLAVKKVYFDPMTGENVGEFVSASEFIVNDATKDLKDCPRASHLLAFYPYEIAENQAVGLWRDKELDIQEPELQTAETFVEMHILYDLDGDEYPEPYIVTFHEKSGTVVRVRANFSPQDILTDKKGKVVKVQPRQYFVKYECFPDPDGGFYGRGLGQLLKTINDTVNSILNQMVDAGHLSNTGGGFLGKGFKTKSGSVRFKPGEWKKTDVVGGILKDNIVPLPVAQPSLVLFQLLGMMVEAGKGIASIQDVMTGGGGQNMPATSVLAMIEQGAKVYTAIFKRLFRSMKEEFQLLYALNGDYLDEKQYQEYLDDPKATIADFEDEKMDITPQADPRMATDIQKMAKAALLKEDLQLPWVNGPEVTVEAWRAAGIQDPERFIKPPPKGPSPEQLVELAELRVKEKDAETKRITAVANMLDKMATTDEKQTDNLLNAMELIAVKDTIDESANDEGAVPGLEGGQ